MIIILSLIPLIGVFGTALYAYFNGVVWQEPVMMIIYWFLSGMGITMGYHRLFAHKSYKTNTFVEWVLMILGSTALENTILKWSSDHRTHHTKAETEDDPYSITKGFWHAHIGWILKNTPEEKNRIRGVKDLEKKSAIKFQNKYYFSIGIIVGFLIPLAIGYMYGRPFGAILWAGFLRLAIVHHATFFINSLCHYVGKRTYDFKSTARDSWFVSWFTFGEGYHNYHHKFQWDYRNGVKWFAYDPSKWIIQFLSYLGITYDLKKTKDYMVIENSINSIRVQLDEKLVTSTENCKVFYNNKVEQLHLKSESILKSWKELERQYTNLVAKGKSNNKNLLEELKKKRKTYNLQMQEIKELFNNILFNVKRNRLTPVLLVS